MSMQLDFFESTDEISVMKKTIEEMKDSLDKQRRRQFSMINGFGEELFKLKAEIDRMTDVLSIK
jgi:hypothetical protein